MNGWTRYRHITDKIFPDVTGPISRMRLFQKLSSLGLKKQDNATRTKSPIDSKNKRDSENS